jgi:hypothetical protein
MTASSRPAPVKRSQTDAPQRTRQKPPARELGDLSLSDEQRERFVNVAWSTYAVENLVRTLSEFPSTRVLKRQSRILIAIMIPFALLALVLFELFIFEFNLLYLVLAVLAYALALAPAFVIGRRRRALLGDHRDFYLVGQFLGVIDYSDWLIDGHSTIAHRAALARRIEVVAVGFRNTYPLAAGKLSRPESLRTIAKRCADDLRSYEDVVVAGDLEDIRALRDDWTRYVLRLVLGTWSQVHRPDTNFTGLKQVRVNWGRSLSSPTIGGLVAIATLILGALTLFLKH